MSSMFTVLEKLSPSIKQSNKTEKKPSDSFEKSKILRQVISYSEMQQYFKACTRQYKIKNIKSEIYVVDSSNNMLLQDMMVVPYERYENGTREAMRQRSKKIYMQEIKR